MLGLVEAVAVNQGGGQQIFRFHRVARRIATRFGPQTAATWTQALTRFQSTIDPKALGMALASRDIAQVEAVVRGSGFGQMMRGLEDPFRRTAQAAGTASAQVLEEAGFPMQFNAVHPNVVMFARDQAAQLVVDVGDDVKEAIRTVVALGQQQGLTIVQQAQAIRQTVGLPPNWARAPLNLGDQIRKGDIAGATRRRLSAIDKAQIRSRIQRGTVDEAFINKMQENYSKSLINRRALNIARTENLRAANAGQHESWQQAIQQKALPADSRRFWLVTPDERLSFEHAQIPAMNPDGRKMDETFATTEGDFMFPPSRTNCRCGVGLGVGTGGAEEAPFAAGGPQIGSTGAVSAKDLRIEIEDEAMDFVRGLAGQIREGKRLARVFVDVTDPARIVDGNHRAAAYRLLRRKVPVMHVDRAEALRLLVDRTPLQVEAVFRKRLLSVVKPPTLPGGPDLPPVGTVRAPRTLHGGGPAEVADRFATKKVEWGAAWDKDGRVIYNTTSNSRSFVRTPSNPRNPVDIFVHNHPNGSSFSIADMETMTRQNMREFWAVSRHDSFRVIRPPDGWPLARDLEARFNQVQRGLQDARRAAGIKPGTAKWTELERRLTHDTWSTVFGDVGAFYERFTL